MKKKLFSIFLSLAIVVAYVPVGIGPAYGAVLNNNSSVDTLAFTSDTHNKHASSKASDGFSSGVDRLEAWIPAVAKAENDKFEVMGTCGDNGNAGASASDYWNLSEEVLDAIDGNEYIADSTGAYICGNHEYSPGNIGSTTNDVTKRISKSVGVLKEDGDYVIYGFGCTSGNWNEISTSDISKLGTYLENAPKNKPIFILTHYPLHSQGYRNISNADQAISTINAYAEGRTIIVLWGHNHTDVGNGESNYDKIITDKIGSKSINFTYAAAGCMSDSDYSGSTSSGSGAVSGKGLVASINNSNHEVTLKYYKKDYTAFGETKAKVGGASSDTPISDDDPVVTGDISVTPSTDNPTVNYSIQAGKTFTIKVTNGSSYDQKYTFETSSSDTSVAKVQSNARVEIAAGKAAEVTVKGIAAGNSTIKITNNNNSSERKATINLTVTGEGGYVPEEPVIEGGSIDVTPQQVSSGVETKSAAIKTGETLTINVKNNSGNSQTYDFTATSSNPLVAKVVKGSVNIVAGEKKTLTVQGISAGTSTITISNNNTQYGEDYERKSIINLTVTGEGEYVPEDPEDVPESEVISPTHDNPPAVAATIEEGKSLDIKIKNATGNSNSWTYSGASSNGNVEMVKASTGELEPNEVGTITIKGVKAGSAVISISNNNDMEDYVRTATVNVTVTKKDTAVEDAKKAAIAEIEKKAGTNQSAEMKKVVADEIAKINEAKSVEAVNSAKSAAVNAVELRAAKDEAIKEITEAAGKNPSKEMQAVLDAQIAKINSATSIAKVETEVSAAEKAVKEQKQKEEKKPAAKKTVKAIVDSSAVYDGKTHKANIVFTDANGKILKTEKVAGKLPGTYKATYKGNDTYKSLTASWKITVKKTSIKSLKKGKKSFTVKVAKQKKARVTGYQVRYSTSKKGLEKAKKHTISTKYSKTSKTIKKLKSKKTYYVQVRSYKKINGKKYYSGWSTVKKVKTK